MATSYTPALSNMQFDIEYQINDGKDVATRWTTSGNLMTDLYGIPGNGQPVTIRGITITSFLGATVRRESTYWIFQELDEHVTRILEPS
jgi:predicted ester cyclase